jgi:quercetin dioxygenase-like cupin family protein
MRTRMLSGAALALALVVAFAWIHAQGFQRTILQRGDLSVAGHEGVMAMVEFPPGTSAGRHTHPGEEISYVLQGAITLEVQGKPPATLKAGDVFFIEAGKIHDAKNTGTMPAKILATYVVEKGKPMATPVQ